MLVPIISFAELKKRWRIRYVQIVTWGLFPSVTPIRLRLQCCSPFSSSSHGMLSRAQVNKQQRPSSQPLKLDLLAFQRILVQISCSQFRIIDQSCSLPRWTPRPEHKVPHNTTASEHNFRRRNQLKEQRNCKRILLHFAQSSSLSKECEKYWDDFGSIRRELGCKILCVSWPVGHFWRKHEEMCLLWLTWKQVLKHVKKATFIVSFYWWLL